MRSEARYIWSDDAETTQGVGVLDTLSLIAEFGTPLKPIPSHAYAVFHPVSCVLAGPDAARRVHVCLSGASCSGHACCITETRAFTGTY